MALHSETPAINRTEPHDDTGHPVYIKAHTPRVFMGRNRQVRAQVFARMFDLDPKINCGRAQHIQAPDTSEPRIGQSQLGS